MNKTVEILKDIDDVLKQNSERSESNVSIVQNTQEVIDIIEKELSTKDEAGAKGNGVDFSHSFDEPTASWKETHNSVSVVETPKLDRTSESNLVIEQKKLSDSSEAFEDIPKRDRKEILHVQQTDMSGENNCRKELTEGLSSIAHDNLRQDKKLPTDNISTFPKDTSSVAGEINRSEKHHESHADSLQDAMERPHKRLKTTGTAGKNVTDVQKGLEEKVNEDILYTATQLIQKDITLPTQEGSTDVPMDELEIRHSMYNFQGPPRQLTGAWGCFLSESCNNYLRGCKWAPDGTCLMTNSNDNCIRIFNTPEQVYCIGQENMDIDESIPVLKMKETDIIYDYCWYSKMMSCDPDSAFLAVTSKGTPVHLYDAFSGDLRCSFRAFNHVDQLVAAYCVSFDLSGEKLYCGFNKTVRVFDVTRPGRDCVSRPTYAKEGQSGIISCIAHSPTEIGLYAAGSYSRSIALYSEPEGEMICMFDGQQGGVTHIMFSPDGSKLYSGGRKDNEILCWDLRNPGQILYTLERKVSTNQRIYFDITRDGRYLVSGCHDGQVRVWDTMQAPVQIENCQEPILQPVMSFQGHSDTVNGISLNPHLPVVATSSGQRHFPSFDDSSDENTDIEEEQNKIDNSLRLWWIT